MSPFSKALGPETQTAEDLEKAAWRLYDKTRVDFVNLWSAEVKVRRRPEDRDEILRLVKEALIMEPGRASAFVLLGHISMDEGNREAMRDYYLRAIEVSTNPLEEAIWEGMIGAFEDGPFDVLAECLERIYEKKPESVVACKLAKAYSSLGNPQKGIAILSVHLRNAPNDKRCLKLKKQLESEL